MVLVIGDGEKCPNVLRCNVGFELFSFCLESGLWKHSWSLVLGDGGKSLNTLRSNFGFELFSSSMS